MGNLDKAKLDIMFCLDGEPYAVRTWYFAPSRGDIVLLGPEGDKKPYVIKKVVWGNDNDSDMANGRQNISVVIEPDPAPDTPLEENG